MNLSDMAVVGDTRPSLQGKNKVVVDFNRDNYREITESQNVTLNSQAFISTIS